MLFPRPHGWQVPPSHTDTCTSSSIRFRATRVPCDETRKVMLGLRWPIRVCGV